MCPQTGEDGASGGGTLLVDRPPSVYRLATQVAPETDGARVLLRGVGNATLDVGDVDVGVEANKLEFRDAPNVSMERLTIRGANREGLLFGLGPGDGFRFSHLIFDTGQGAINVANGVTDVHGEGIDIRDCDRGVECDDGPTDVTLRRGRIREIDNTGADDAVDYTFSLDAHVHPGRDHLENVTIGGDGSTAAGIVIADAAGIERLRVSDYRAERPVAGAALSVVAGGFDDGVDGGYGAVLEDCRIDGDGTGIDVHGDNPPILVRGGSIRGASRRCPPAPGSTTSAG